MDNKQELKQEIQGLKEDLRLCNINHTAIGKRLLSLEKELAEAEKPKLKEWDLIEWIGEDITNKGVNLVLTKDFSGEGFNQIRIRDGVKGTIHNITPDDKFIKHFNLADDLQALSEPLEEFEYGGCTIEIDSKGNLDFEDLAYVDKKDIPDFILNLRRMLVWKLAQEAKNKTE